MNQISPDQLLTQIRALQAELQPKPMVETTPSATADFGGFLSKAVDNVNSAQSHATELKRGFQSGREDVSLAEVMIASQKADLSFRALTEARNKLVNAYQEIMNMPV